MGQFLVQVERKAKTKKAFLMLLFTHDAIDDIECIRDHLEVFSTKGASGSLLDLLTKLDLLEEFPLMGTRCQYAVDGNELRDLVVARFIVRYMVRGEDVIILRVWLQNQNRDR